MELLIVGSGAAYPDRPGTASSTYVVAHAGRRLCLDLGQGGFAGLAGRFEPSGLEAVVISHLHPDHFIDLVALRHYLRYEFVPARRVRVIAPAGLADRLDGLLAEPGFAGEALDVEVRSTGQVTVGPFVLESTLVTHTDESYAVRVAPAGEPDAPGIVYSGDCGRAADLEPLIRPGDVLLTEVAFGAGPVPVGDLHLDGPAVGALAAATRPGRVLLTHLQMGRDPAAAIAAVRALYDGPVDLVADGETWTV
ncbi:MAG: MBL fold metallo-hydrolase [Chloroflexi bacterium]|jgi:ribonuclease BN (tRNA processing enzyme)|nr:MBL fold metallo-hydrolase [Chloroflexota bacterium]